MQYGYARVSTRAQDSDIQIAALRAAGCDEIMSETGSGARRDRPVLAALLERLQPGDTLVVWKLDRLSRSLSDLLTTLERIEHAGAGFICTTQQIDTTTPAGRLMAQMIGAFAEFERTLIAERLSAGIARAAAQGRHRGRPRKLSESQRNHIRNTIERGQANQAEMAKLFNVSPATISRFCNILRS